MAGKTLWILNHYAVLPTETGGTRHYELATRLANAGWHCVIIAASYSHWEKKQRINGPRCFIDRHVESVQFRFIWTPAYSNSGIFRIFNMFCYFLNALFPWTLSGLAKPDVIIGSSVHPMAALAGRILAKRYHAPFVFEVRDLWPQTLIAMGRIRAKSISARALRTLEKILYRSAEKIIVLPPRADLYIKQYGIPTTKIEWIPNGVEIGSRSPFKEMNHTLEIIYLGAHGQANRLDTILEAIAILDKKALPAAVRYRFIGEGEQKPQLIEKSMDLGLKNVKFEPGVPKNRVSSVLSGADALILTVRDLPDLYRYGVAMNKLYDYMASGRPVITAMRAANNPVEEAKAGICVGPDDPDKLADAIEKIVAMPEEERMRLGENGRRFVETYYDYDVLAEKLKKLLDELPLEC